MKHGKKMRILSIDSENQRGAYLEPVDGQSLSICRSKLSRIETDGSVSRRWRMSGLDMTANVVCKACNETWMSNIESSMRNPQCLI